MDDELVGTFHTWHNVIEQVLDSFRGVPVEEYAGVAAWIIAARKLLDGITTEQLEQADPATVAMFRAFLAGDKVREATP